MDRTEGVLPWRTRIHPKVESWVWTGSVVFGTKAPNTCLDWAAKVAPDGGALVRRIGGVAMGKVRSARPSCAQG